MKKNIYPPDAPEFLRAIESAKNASDVSWLLPRVDYLSVQCLRYAHIILQKEYTKQKWDVITNYRGYQTMDSRDHPDVTRGQKANDLISNVSL